jgi:gamma-glutamyl-gamma-aminobutyrate hydrolase PuuD
MVEVCRYARENLIPYLGICLGLQISVIEFCRNVLGIKTANSKEFDEKAEHDVITTMDDVSYENFGGTLRKGAKKTYIKNNTSLAYKIYGSEYISERHRHRYEVNPKYISKIEEKGMIFSGKDPDSDRMSICEIPTHPFFLGTQYHPEFKSNPFNPTPIFYSFVLASSKQYDKLRNYFINHIPAIKSLEVEGESEIKSEDPKYQNLFDKILSGKKIFNELNGAVKVLDENLSKNSIFLNLDEAINDKAKTGKLDDTISVDKKSDITDRSEKGDLNNIFD